MKRISHVLLTGLLLFTVINSYSQNGTNSPYSRYGFGLMSDRSLGFNKGMSGVSQGFRHGQETNVSNPASYSAIDSLTALIDFGLSFQNGNYKMNSLQKNAKNTSVDYFTFQFRAFKNLGMSFGVLFVGVGILAALFGGFVGFFAVHALLKAAHSLAESFHQFGNLLAAKQ